jgi:ferrochelatase
VIALAGEGRAVGLDKIRHYHNDPGFVAANADAVSVALDELPGELREGARVVFVTHSVPDAMDAGAGPEGHRYTAQHTDTATAVAAAVAAGRGAEVAWDLVYCSRSGPPTQPWLEPDVNDHLRELSASGTRAVVVAPIGFVSDHMEVVFDLDTEAAATAAGLGLAMARAATVGTDPRFVAGLVDLCLERAAQARGEAVQPATAGGRGPSWAVCPAGCCPNQRVSRPAAAGEDWVPPAVAAITTEAARRAAPQTAAGDGASGATPRQGDPVSPSPRGEAQSRGRTRTRSGADHHGPGT